MNQKLSRTIGTVLSISRMFDSRAAKVGIGIILGVLAMALIGPYIIPISPNATSVNIDAPPSFAHLFGTDYIGHDVLSEIIWGAYPSMIVGIIASLGAVVIGTLVGVISGYFNNLEAPLIGAADVVLAFPPLLLLILFGELFIATDVLITLILIVVMWPPVARAIRSQVLSIRERQYVESSRTSGLGDWSIIGRVILPSVTGISFAYFTLTVAASIVLIAALEFLGIGDPDVVSWGSMLYWAQQFAFYSGDWWWILAPGVFITLVALAFALVGFSFEEVMNPRLRT